MAGVLVAAVASVCGAGGSKQVAEEQLGVVVVVSVAQNNSVEWND